MEKAEIKAFLELKINRLKWLFQKEFKGECTLDSGFGDGALLVAFEVWRQSKDLRGIDISGIISIPSSSIKFKQNNILNYKLGQKIDVVFLDNIYEYFVPSDIPFFYEAINIVVKLYRKLRLWTSILVLGPSVVTRIIDFTYSVSSPARGTHLNESSNNELLPNLEKMYFGMFKSIFPLSRIMYLFNWLRFPSVILSKLERNSGFLKKTNFWINLSIGLM